VNPSPEAARVGSPEPLPLAADEGLEGTEPIEERLALGGRGLREHTARGALINSAFHIGYALLGLVQRVAVAAFLTTGEYGLWGILVTTLVTLGWLKQIGISEKYVQQDERDQELAFQKAFTLELAYTLCFYVVVVVALPLYALAYGRTEILLPGFVLSLAFLGTALHAPIWIAYRQMRFLRQRSLEALNPVVSALVTIGLAAAGLGYWSLVLGAVAGSFAAALGALLTCPYPIRLRFERGTLREYVGFSWPLLLSSSASLIVVQGAVLVGNFTVGLAGLGVLALATNFAVFADRVDSIVRATIYPAVCAVRDRTDLLLETFTKSNRLALMWAFPFGAGLALFAGDLVTHVLGERWREAAGLIGAFGLILATRQIAFNWVAFFSAVGNTRPFAVNGALQLVVFALVTAPLMIWIGLTGYAVGVAVSVVAELALRAHYLRTMFTDFRLAPHVARAVLPAVPAVAVVLGIRAGLDVERTAAVAASELGIYAAVGAASIYVFERRFLNEIFGYFRGALRAAPTA
jgi:O-antigen/teichoic acid export membrane protein